MTIDRRRTPRAMLAQPVTAWVAGLPMHLVELGAAGARVEHDAPVGIRREMKLRFELDGVTLVLSCIVTRCRLQRSLARSGAATYTSGLRFTVPNEPSRELLRTVVSRMLGGLQCEAAESAVPTTAV